MKLPPLASLRFFDVAARYESFVKAAQELHVTHSAISRQIRLLEEHLGIHLFERRNRAIFLTLEGKLLFQTTTSMFQQLAETVKQLEQPPDIQVVNLSCEPTIAMKWLIPRLTDFYRQYPDITVHLIAAGGPIDLLKLGLIWLYGAMISNGMIIFIQHEFVQREWESSNVSMIRHISE
ncbi:Gcv operon activator [Providencia rustigianii]|nr:Gcv operon activator [Providencia rustigianii]